MARNCPYCDLYTTNDSICIHCGEKLPNDNQQFVNNTVEYSNTKKSGFGFFFKFVILFAFIVAFYFGYQTIFSNSSIPSYMNTGPIDLQSKVVEGKVNIFDFYSDFCGPCKQISPYLKKLKAKRNDLYIEQIDINRPGIRGIDWHSPIIKQFKIRSIPYFIVIDEKGKIMKKGKSAYKYVIKIINKERL